MKFKPRATDADSQGQHDLIYPTQSASSSSTYSYFTEQAICAEFSSGNFGGDHIGIGSEILRRRSETREAIQREVEKQRIREEIMAEEMERKRILEEEVRNELRMERDMMYARNGGGFSSPFVPLSLPPGHDNLFEPRVLYRQPIGFEERIIMSLDEKYTGGGNRRNIRGFEAPFQRFGDSPKIERISTPLSEGTKKEIIVLGKPNGETLSGTKRKPTPSVHAHSSEPCSDGLKKKPKEDWSCAICQVSATSERTLNEHLQGKKHQTQEAALIARKTGANIGLGVALAPNKPIVNLSCSENKSKFRTNKKLSKFDSNDAKKEDGMTGGHKKYKFKFWCEICQVGAFSEIVMKDHKEGKKHLTNLDELQKAPAAGEKAAAEVKEVDGLPREHRGDKFKFWCEMCEVGAFCEKVMKKHKEGKRHLNNLVEFLQKDKVKSEAPATDNKTSDAQRMI